jgi:hypothetical protein
VSAEVFDDMEFVAGERPEQADRQNHKRH